MFTKGQKVRVTEKYQPGSENQFSSTPGPIRPGDEGEVEFVMTKDGYEWDARQDDESDLDHYSVVFPNGQWDSFQPDEIEEITE